MWLRRSWLRPGSSHRETRPLFSPCAGVHPEGHFCMSRSHLTHRTSLIMMPSCHLTLLYCHFLTLHRRHFLWSRTRRQLPSSTCPKVLNNLVQEGFKEEVMELWDINTQVEAAACFNGCSPSRPQIRTVLSPPHEASNVPAGFHLTDQHRESGWALSFWTDDKVSFISDQPWSYADVRRCHSRRYNNKRRQRTETPTESPELVKVSDGEKINDADTKYEK